MAHPSSGVPESHLRCPSAGKEQVIKEEEHERSPDCHGKSRNAKVVDIPAEQRAAEPAADHCPGNAKKGGGNKPDGIGPFPPPDNEFRDNAG